VCPARTRARGDPTGLPPTRYRHFHDRNQLVEACLDRSLAEVAASVCRQQPWREQLSALALAYFEAIVAHPVIGAEAGHRTTAGPGELAILEVLLAALVDAGLPRKRVVRYHSLLAGYAASMAAAGAAYRLQDNRIQRIRDRIWVGTQGLYDRDRYPTAIELRDEFATLRTDDVFASGFEMLLDAVEAAIDRA
jgi:AcrR family transcriptional regulator